MTGNLVLVTQHAIAKQKSRQSFQCRKDDGVLLVIVFG